MYSETTTAVLTEEIELKYWVQVLSITGYIGNPPKFKYYPIYLVKRDNHILVDFKSVPNLYLAGAPEALMNVTSLYKGEDKEEKLETIVESFLASRVSIDITFKLLPPGELESIKALYG